MSRCRDILNTLSKNNNYDIDNDVDGSIEGSSFFSEYYGTTEGGNIRSDDAGWICAQRRSGRTLGWLHSQYYQGGIDYTGSNVSSVGGISGISVGSVSIPDYLMVVDDDTYVDMERVLTLLEQQQREEEEEGAVGTAGCLIEMVGGYRFPYGGFGTILNKKAIEQLSQPIYCSNDNHNGDDNDDSSKGNNNNEFTSNHKAICSQIERNAIGEAALFSNGMTVFQLFYLYSSVEHFCFHSDWVLGYILEYYIHNNVDNDDADNGEETTTAKSKNTLLSVEKYPSCGNRTVDTNAVRPCTADSAICHYQDPQDMERLSLANFKKHPEAYDAVPKLSSTAMDTAWRIMEDVKVMFRHSIPPAPVALFYESLIIPHIHHAY